jgi:hypothetical protein
MNLSTSIMPMRSEFDFFKVSSTGIAEPGSLSRILHKNMDAKLNLRYTYATGRYTYLFLAVSGARLIVAQFHKDIVTEKGF